MRGLLRALDGRRAASACRGARPTRLLDSLGAVSVACPKFASRQSGRLHVAQVGHESTPTLARSRADLIAVSAFSYRSPPGRRRATTAHAGPGSAASASRQAGRNRCSAAAARSARRSGRARSPRAARAAQAPARTRRSRRARAASAMPTRVPPRRKSSTSARCCASPEQRGMRARRQLRGLALLEQAHRRSAGSRA